MLGEIGENFAVEVDVGFLEVSDELVVGKSFSSGGGTNLYLPETAGKTFFLATVIELESPGMQKSLLGLAVFVLSAPHETLGVFEQILSSFVGGCSAFYSWHVS